jgi:LmbE family N-acetylglucosaminyl deacetylase
LCPSQLLAQPIQPGEARVELGLALRQLNTVGSFMMATAHPDDENNALLALLAKGQGHRTALVTATRGDGGQNEIGPELFDALAVLRTEELLAAHRLDGAEQYFTRAADFGYSFSRDETFQRWGREEILGDFVRMIRHLRPDVVTAMSPEGQGGGQHHQASAVLAREAFTAAADATRFPEQLEEGLRPWQARKFYFSSGFPFGFGLRDRGRAAPPPPGTTTVDLAGYDMLLGRTYAEIGSHARSMHKCQGMSPMLSLPGPASAQYRLVESTVPDRDGQESGVFDGVDTSIEGLARFVSGQVPESLDRALSELGNAARRARRGFDSGDLAATRAEVISGLGVVRELRARLGSLELSEEAEWEIEFRLALKERQFERAAILAHGLRLEALADDGEVTGGQQVMVSSFVANRGSDGVTVRGVSLGGLALTSPECEAERLLAAGVYRCSVDATVPATSGSTSIHWTHVPGSDRYAFDADVPFGVPFRPTPFTATFDLEIGGLSIAAERSVQYRDAHDVFAGEKRTTLHVVPRLSLSMTPEITVVPAGTGGSRAVRVTVTNAWPGPAKGEVGLDLPMGWTAEPPTSPVRFTREDESQTVRFTVTPADGANGAHSISAFATSGGVRYDSGYQSVEYPHIARRHLVRPAETTLKVIDVELPADLTVGYIVGVGDAVPQAIEQLGARLEFIDGEALAWGDLSRFDVIVTGVRAYERRADLRANNNRLLRYVEAGGTLIVQYNKFEFNAAQYGPYAAEVSRNRVTDEDAPVRVLRADHPVFGWPNSIGPTTWADWVQERGLYFLGDRDPAYVDLVELEDSFDGNPGVKRGALVEARFGDGRWIYVGLGLWRQLPAGTTGAYQLLANLLSVGRTRTPH